MINFDVVDGEKQLLKSFDPPIRLYIAFTQGDLKNAEDDYHKLAFAYLDDSNTWVKFDIDKHGYTLLQTQDGGNTFLSWDSGSSAWLPLVKEGNSYKIDGENVQASQLGFAYKVISSFQDFIGFAFVHVSDWNDRHIGAGS